MNRFFYVVESIDGDYAHLRQILEESAGAEAVDAGTAGVSAGTAGGPGESKLVARALLPPEIVEGTKLLYEWMQYSIIS